MVVRCPPRVRSEGQLLWALLRRGTDDELSGDPERRLRLTVGLREHEDRWVVAHEHHSFPDKS